MEQVIEHGETDAMHQIQECLKDMIVINKRSKECDEKLKFQDDTDKFLDNTTKELEKKILKLELEVKSKGLSLDQLEEDILSLQLSDPTFIEVKKKKVEKHAINAIHKKFYTKFKDQKAAIEDILIHHNEFIKTLQDEGDNDETITSEAQLLNIDEFPLIQEITKILSELHGCIPAITSRLPWQGMNCPKPRSTSSNSRGIYKNNKVTFNNRYTSSEIYK